MFVGIGTIINIFAILIGSTIGIATGSKFRPETKELITDVLGFTVILAGADALISLWKKSFVLALPRGWPLLTILTALLLGALIGSALHLEERLSKLGEYLKVKFSRSTGNAHEPGKYVEGFVTASLIFGIGPLAILGGISDGMGTGTSQLILKSMLDFFAAIAFASTLGWGVALSALPVAVYQFTWTAVGFFLGNIMSDYEIAAMTATGGVLLLGIGLRLLKIRAIAIGNLLPAIFLAPVVALLVHQFI
jgi:uncharacterized membrane protein YqgA involved in biofilm formation